MESDRQRNSMTMGTAMVLGGSLVIASVILAVGVWFGLDRAAGRIDRALRDSGDRIGHPEIKVIDPLRVQEPLKIRGVADDGALPVNAKLGKGE
jgi:hypothetical protein